MFARLFPRTIDNDYRGSWLAIWLLAPVLLLKTLMGINVAGLNPWISSRYVMVKADGIPLDTFSPEAQEISVFLFTSWGLGLLMLCFLAVVALIRYRAMLPLAILLLAIEQIGRKIISTLIMSPGDPFSFGAVINWGLSIALILALVLSVTPRKGRKTQ